MRNERWKMRGGAGLNCSGDCETDVCFFPGKQLKWA